MKKLFRYIPRVFFFIPLKAFVCSSFSPFAWVQFLQCRLQINFVSALWMKLTGKLKIHWECLTCSTCILCTSTSERYIDSFIKDKEANNKLHTSELFHSSLHLNCVFIFRRTHSTYSVIRTCLLVLLCLCLSQLNWIKCNWNLDSCEFRSCFYGAWLTVLLVRRLHSSREHKQTKLNSIWIRCAVHFLKQGDKSTSSAWVKY